MLYLIGLGLGDERDITVKGLEAIKSCDKVFLEAYTSILGVDRERLEAFYGRPVIEADRNLVEQGADQILEPARTSNVAFLVVGDVFGYTRTHTKERARERAVRFTVGLTLSMIDGLDT